jgi:microcin C transport system substrate-binding protein
MRLSRRSIIRSGLVAAVAPALDRVGLPLAAPAIAQNAEWTHAFSVFGEIKYPAGFKQFDYVNPNPPKGGIVRLPATAPSTISTWRYGERRIATGSTSF